MENLLPPLIILLCVVAVVVLILRRGTKRTQASIETASAGGAEAAAAASARLSEDQHRAIYSLIAQGLTVQAIAAYRLATGVKLTEARNAVLLMERHPRPYGDEQPKSADAEGAEKPAEEEVTAQQEPVRESAPEQQDRQQPEPAPPSPPEAPTPTTAAASGERSTTRFPYRYRAIVSNGRQTLEVASNLLNEEIYAEIKALAQIGDAEDAAQLLWRHSDISIEEARAFVELL
jgi:ribosomal protein L7/L12